MEVKTFYSPHESAHEVRTKISVDIVIELFTKEKKQQFVIEVFRQMAEKLAEKIMERLTPAINRALEEISLQEEPEPKEPELDAGQY